MNRCILALRHPFFAFCCWAALCLATVGAQAQPLRNFPPGVQRGVLQITQAPEVLLNGKPDRLSPGARIRGPNNMLVNSAALQGQASVIFYQRERGGLLHEVWILTPAEVRASQP